MTKNKAPEVLDSTSINAKVDFSLTKDDLTEMVLEERYEFLEDEYNRVNKQLRVHEKEMKELTDKHNDYIQSVAKKACSKRIKAAEKFFDAVALSNINGGNHIISPSTTCTYEIYEQDGYGSKRRRKVEKAERVNGWSVYNSVQFTVSSKKPKDDDTINLGGGQWSITKCFSDEEITEMPFVKKLIALDDARKKLQTQSTLLKVELANLETSGKRARAKMVKALLGASEQGRALLSKMPKMNNKLLTA